MRWHLRFCCMLHVGSRRCRLSAPHRLLGRSAHTRARACRMRCRYGAGGGGQEEGGGGPSRAHVGAIGCVSTDRVVGCRRAVGATLSAVGLSAARFSGPMVRWRCAVACVSSAARLSRSGCLPSRCRALRLLRALACDASFGFAFRSRCRVYRRCAALCAVQWDRAERTHAHARTRLRWRSRRLPACRRGQTLAVCLLSAVRCRCTSSAARCLLEVFCSISSAARRRLHAVQYIDI